MKIEGVSLILVEKNIFERAKLIKNKAIYMWKLCLELASQEKVPFVLQTVFQISFISCDLYRFKKQSVWGVALMSVVKR